MSKCSSDHWIKDGKGHEHIIFWRCPECQWEYIKMAGLISLAFSVPALYIVFGDTVVGEEGPDGEKGTTLGLWMIFIMWWTLLGLFFHYREIIKNLKYELLKMKATSCKLTREEIEDASKKDLMERLKYFLEYTRKEEQNNTKILNHNIKAIDLLLTSFSSDDFDESYGQFIEHTSQTKN